MRVTSRGRVTIPRAYAGGLTRRVPSTKRSSTPARCRGSGARVRARRVSPECRRCPLVTVVDLGLSNLESVLRALRRVGAEARATRDPAQVEAARALVLPGVGAFGDGMASLRDARLIDPIRAHAAAGRPLLGICLGMQLLADMGTERGAFTGLGLVPGTVVRLSPPDPAFRVPNVGWCDTEAVRSEGPVARDGCFHFAHSHHLLGDPIDVQAGTDIGGQHVAAAVARENVWGVQFRPEKSQDDGLAVLEHFLARIARGVPA